MSDPLPRDSSAPARLDDVERVFRSTALVAARRRVLRQLFESLIFEKIVPHDELGDVAGVHFKVHGLDEQGRAVAYTGVGRRRHTFDRVRLGAAPLRREVAGEAEEAQSIAQFLIETRGAHQAASDRLIQMIHELEQTQLKDAQSLALGHPLVAPEASYEDLESGIGNGHPYHPGYKSRVGFDWVDNLSYGPEFAPSVQPVWVAAEGKSTPRAVIKGLDAEGFLRREVGDAIWKTWATRLADAGADTDTHVIFPVHPWQWQTQALSLLGEDIHTGRLIQLGATPSVYRPQQSIRTLANHSEPRKASLKHSLSILNTSTSRILAPHTVLNAPLISEWLSGLLRRDPFLNDSVRPILLREVMGVAYDPPQLDLVQARTYGAFSCIWRESVHEYLDPGERVAPWAALTALDAAGRPFIEPWLRPSPRAWLDRLLEVAVVPVVHFLVAHGVGLESHAQNMLLVHRDGLPTRVVLKDFHDGIRFSPGHVAEPGRIPGLHPTPARHVRVNRNSYLTVEDPREVRDFVFDAFFFINLGELAMFLADHAGLPEEDFWEQVEKVLSSYVARLPSLRARCELYDIKPGNIEVEKLTNRRLFPETDVQTHSVRCPWSFPRVEIKARS
jgi:2-[(L-alanin-3-ylcarbamoyl)methyl]-3-(2-aminoethylcarbamoyl)-2-hydroxypropanoate synthase